MEGDAMSETPQREPYEPSFEGQLEQMHDENAELQRQLDIAIAAHQQTIEGYTELRARYDTLHRQFTELCDAIERMK